MQLRLVALNEKLSDKLWLTLYQNSLLNPKLLKKFNIHLSSVEYETLCYHFKDEPRRIQPRFTIYDYKEKDYFVKELELSNDSVLKIRSKDITKRISIVLREKKILTYKEYLIAVALNKYTNQLYTRNY